jgi:hypothetical protein
MQANPVRVNAMSARRFALLVIILAVGWSGCAAAPSTGADSVFDVAAGVAPADDFNPLTEPVTLLCILAFIGGGFYGEAHSMTFVEGAFAGLGVYMVAAIVISLIVY